MTDQDWELLARFGNTRDTEAFAELVRRHIDVVYAAARRQAGGHADDVTQAVFILLSQKAAALKPHGSLAAWLYGATRLCCLNANKIEARRQFHERKAASAEATTMDLDTDAAEYEALLDAGLASLGGTERNAIVLRYLQRKSFGDTGRQLGISEQAARKRVDRALVKLRQFFAKQGHVIGIEAVVVLTERASAIAPPAGLLEKTLLTATVGTPSTGAATSIARAAERTISRQKTTIALGLSAAAVILVSIAIAGLIAAAQLTGKPANASAAPAPNLVGTSGPTTRIAVPADLKASEIVLLALATRARYTSLEVQSRSSVYNTATVGPGDKPSTVYDLLWRWSGHRTFSRTTNVSSPVNANAATLKSTETATGPELVKSLRTFENTPVAPQYLEANIHRPDMQSQDDGLLENVWGNFGTSWTDLAAATTHVTYDDAAGLFKLEPATTPDSVRRVVTIDPSHGFLPIAVEVFGKGDKPAVTIQLSDLRDVGQGLWLPFRYCMTLFPSNMCVVREMSAIKVNPPLADADLEIAFPNAADVIDDVEMKRTGHFVDPPPRAGRAFRPQPGRVLVRPASQATIVAEDAPTAANWPRVTPQDFMPAQGAAGRGLLVLGRQPYVTLQRANPQSPVDQVIEIGRGGRAEVGAVTVRSPKDFLKIQEIESVDPTKIRLRVSTTPATDAPAGRAEHLIVVQGADEKDRLRIPVIITTMPALEIAPDTIRLDGSPNPVHVAISGWAAETATLERWEIQGDGLQIDDCKLIEGKRELQIAARAKSGHAGVATGRIILHLKSGTIQMALPIDCVYLPPIP